MRRKTTSRIIREILVNINWQTTRFTVAEVEADYFGIVGRRIGNVYRDDDGEWWHDESAARWQGFYRTLQSILHSQKDANGHRVMINSVDPLLDDDDDAEDESVQGRIRQLEWFHVDISTPQEHKKWGQSQLARSAKHAIEGNYHIHQANRRERSERRRRRAVNE